MHKLWSIKCVVFLLLVVISCKEPFNPNIPSSQTNYLVVEGYINSNGSTSIALRRTLPLADSSKIKPELNAQVAIEGEDNSVFQVRETGDGTYASASLILPRNQKYRLHIKTASGGEYLSGFATVKPTPAIDSINWKAENDGVHIYVNTHDPQNNTRYYKWDYQETWEIHSAFASYVKYVNGGITGRTLSETEKLFYCWRTVNSSSILVGSTAQLESDIMHEAPVMFIPYESEKTSVRYSILVKQYSLDRKAYDFYRLLKSNTESLGSVFDPLPSDIAGNIICVSNPKEKVIGYITAATVDEKRIFISSSEVHSQYMRACPSFYVKNDPDSLKKNFESGLYQPYLADPAAGPPRGYFASLPECLDCTLRGSSVKPSFW